MKERIIKRTLSLCTATALCAGVLIATPAVADSTDVDLVINGQAVYTDAAVGAPYITDNGRTMLPLRVISESLDCNVTYANGNVYIENDKNNFHDIFKPDVEHFYVNGKRIDMDTELAISKEGRSYVPARALGETFGKVDWNNDTRTVTITQENWNNNDDPYTTKALAIANTPYTVNIGNGSTPTTAKNIYLKLTDTKANEGTEVAMPTPVAEWFTNDNLGDIWLKHPKVVANQITTGVYRTSVAAKDYMMDVVGYQKDSGATATYLGKVVQSSDYTTDGTYLYSTDGLYQGGFSIDTNRLYIEKIGDSTNRQMVDVGFAINECTLQMENGKLIATDLDGNRHEVDVEALIK